MNQHSFHWKRTLLRPKPSLSTRETASLRSLWQQTVIAREHTLRTKPSPSTRGRLLHFVRSDNKLSLREGVLCDRSNLQVREGDCFTSFAVTINCHCERARFANEAISKYERETASLRSQWQQTVIARERTLRTKQSPLWAEDGFAEFTLSEANVFAMTGPAGGWVSFAHDDSCFL